jgi:hypothetical protein
VDINANAYRFFVRGTGGGAVVVQSSIQPNDTWQHLVAVYSQPLNRFRLYVNGTEVARGTPAAGLLQNSHEVSIGSRQLGAGPYDLNFNGRLDESAVDHRGFRMQE